MLQDDDDGDDPEIQPPAPALAEDTNEISAAEAMARLAPTGGVGMSSSGCGHGTAETHGTGEVIGDDARYPADQIVQIEGGGNTDLSYEEVMPSHSAMYAAVLTPECYVFQAWQRMAPGGTSTSDSGFAHGTAESGTAESRSMISFS